MYMKYTLSQELSINFVLFCVLLLSGTETFYQDGSCTIDKESAKTIWTDFIHTAISNKTNEYSLFSTYAIQVGNNATLIGNTSALNK